MEEDMQAMSEASVREEQDFANAPDFLAVCKNRSWKKHREHRACVASHRALMTCLLPPLPPCANNRGRRPTNA